LSSAESHASAALFAGFQLPAAFRLNRFDDTITGNITSEHHWRRSRYIVSVVSSSRHLLYVHFSNGSFSILQEPQASTVTITQCETTARTSQWKEGGGSLSSRRSVQKPARTLRTGMKRAVYDA
jgi:hypothetical protein